MESFPSPLPVLVKAILHPRFLLQGTFQYLMDWSYTRQWSTLWRVLPAAVIAVIMIALISLGNYQSRAELASHYLKLASEEVEGFSDGLVSDGAAAASVAASQPTVDEAQNQPAGTEDASAEKAMTDRDELLMEQASVSDYGQMLLRRVLQLQDSNQRAKYLVAVEMANGGRLGQARSMMRHLAPAGDQGFAPAHAWLAVDFLNQGDRVLDPQQSSSLLNDLAVATSWSGSGARLTGIYASLLEKSGQVGEALTVLSEAAASSDYLRLMLADMAKRHGRIKTYADITSVSKQKLEAKIRGGERTVEDYISLAQFFLLDGDAEKAHQALERALALDPNRPELKRLRSEAYRLQYLSSMQVKDGQLQARLGLLDAALRVDPSNPKVGEEIAKLQAMGQATSNSLEQALQRQVGNGEATAVAHMFLAERKLRNGEIALAVPHLKIALQQAPGSPTAQNNLALALALTDPSQLEQAMQLSQLAISNAPGNAEYIDTLGQIREISGDLTGAIECYQQAIRLDKDRIQSRQMLAKAFREMGLEEEADLQLQIIDSIQQEKQKSSVQAEQVEKTTN
ncbi:MAG: hypothetical protein NXI32_30280 [bacterium]|nr:hypothetical protein [bacterium]